MSLETQNFVPPEDRWLTVSAYRKGMGANTDTLLIDTETGSFREVTTSEDSYDEPEGVFPDGQFTLTESAPHGGDPWPAIDLYKTALDGSGEQQRLTHFADFKGFKASQGIVSDDGRWMCFQIGAKAAEAGAGYGIFLFDLRLAEDDKW
jgi:hypothetical protein